MIIEMITTTLMCARYDEIYPLSNNVQMSSYFACRPRVKILWKWTGTSCTATRLWARTSSISPPNPTRIIWKRYRTHIDSPSRPAICIHLHFQRFPGSGNGGRVFLQAVLTRSQNATPEIWFHFHFLEIHVELFAVRVAQAFSECQQPVIRKVPISHSEILENAKPVRYFLLNSHHAIFEKKKKKTQKNPYNQCCSVAGRFRIYSCPTYTHVYIL